MVAFSIFIYNGNHVTYCIQFSKNGTPNKSTKAKIFFITVLSDIKSIIHMLVFFIHITKKYCLFRDKAILNIKILMQVNKANQTLYIKYVTQLQVIKSYIF